jgi:hypothetical protein
MEVIDKSSALWNYLEEDLKGLVLDGEHLLSDVDREVVTDYSYLVFPFSKAYEGFLKRFFLDLDLIREDEYYGDSIRIGRILNPAFIKKKFSVYRKLRGKPGTEDVAERLWDIWKRGRNLVFHYFPHNFRKLSYDEALDIIRAVVDSMDLAVMRCSL